MVRIQSNRCLIDKKYLIVVVEFQPNSYTVDEDDGIVSFVLVKRTPTTQDVTVQISTVGGSATSGSCIPHLMTHLHFLRNR